MPIIPTIGRVVLFRPASTTPGFVDLAQPFAATVAFVNDDGTLNLTVANHFGNHFSAQNVPLVQDDELYPLSDIDYAYWMPYQIAAAAAIEARTTK